MTQQSTRQADTNSAKQHMAQSVAAIDRHDWESARRHARLAGAQFEREADSQGLFQAADVLEKLRDVVESARLLSIVGRLRMPCDLPEWSGESLAGKTLLIVQRIRDIGAPIRQARVIGLVAAQAGRCIVLATPRLVPILRRSFPGVEVRSDELDAAATWAESDVVASYETLVWRAYADDAVLARSFQSLSGDAGVAKDFVRAIGIPGLPRVGISWFSTNRAKDVPPLAEWARLIQRTEANFVSLQYGDTTADRAAMRTASGRELIHDDSVDQLQDIDRYAAQVVAMDLVVTISNTLAQLAGSLGVRTIVILDDKIHLIWPLHGDDCAWYPRTTLLHRQGREWALVFDQIHALLRREFDGMARQDAEPSVRC